MRGVTCAGTKTSGSDSSVPTRVSFLPLFIILWYGFVLPDENNVKDRKNKEFTIVPIGSYRRHKVSNANDARPCKGYGARFPRKFWNLESETPFNSCT